MIKVFQIAVQFKSQWSSIVIVQFQIRTWNCNSFSFNEVIAAQTTHHISALQPVKSQRGGFDIDLEVGAIEPLFKLTQ